MENTREIGIYEVKKDPNLQSKFKNLFALSFTLTRSIITTNFKPSELFGNSIVLSSLGEQYVSKIQKAMKAIDYNEIKVSLFMTFIAEDLLIDICSTDFEGIKMALETELLVESVKFPWIYGRLLYDKFFDMYPHNPDTLSYDDTLQILENTPQGVYQVGELLIGPFGIMHSNVDRILPPTLSCHLWHCSDPSCSSIHTVEFSKGDSISESAYFYLTNINGTEIDLSEYFAKLTISEEGFYDESKLERLPFLISECFSESEIRKILEVIIERHPGEIRPKFPTNDQFKSLFNGTSAQITSRLNKAQCFQVILTMSNEIIAECLEWAIEKMMIRIPATEIRSSSLTNGMPSWFTVHVECSRFGIRTVTPKEKLSLIKMKNMIWSLYNNDEEIADLEWKLRQVEGRNVYDKLDKYIFNGDPKEVIRNLVFSSAKNLKRAFKFLRHGVFELPMPEEEDRLIEKLLWKLGFDIAQYPHYQNTFWERHKKLSDVTSTNKSFTERDKESIRSAAVNFFVSLEEILDYSLSFITWALLGDHYAKGEFKCNLNEARVFMATQLNGYQFGGETTLVLNSNGRNTLGPLIYGFKALSNICNKLVDQRHDHLRPENDLPHFYGKTQIYLFPFLHRSLVLDLRLDCFENISKLLNEITTVFEQNQVANVRNRLEHQRPEEEFPTQIEIENALSAISIMVSKMEDEGICPLVYLYTGSEKDEYGRSSVHFTNFKGRRIKLRNDSQYDRCSLPSLSEPQVIVPSMNIGESSELLRFSFEEPSDYVEMWQNYPKRQPKRTYPIVEEKA